MMKDILKPTLVIVAVAFLCVVALSQVQKLTAPTIAARMKEKQARALALVLPGFDMGEERTSRLDGKEFKWWEGEKQADGAARRGYAFMTRGRGYGGDIETMVGVDEAGVILGLSVISQAETPGLGDRCVEVAARETLWDHLLKETPLRDLSDEAPVPWFQNQFKGINTGARIAITRRGDWSPDMKEDLLATNAISALTGASVTTGAVVKSVEEGMALLVRARQSAGTKQ
jgi:RnfABCDGE-type electron transport complex G subunit